MRLALLFTPARCLWWLLLAAILVLTARSFRQLNLETDILDLLPEEQRDPAIGLLRRTVSGQTSQLVVFLVGADESERATVLARELEQALSANPRIHSVHGNLSSMGQKYHAAYFEQAFAILPPEIRALLERADAPQALAERVTRMLYRPEAGYYSRLLAEDPLLIFPALAEYWGEIDRELVLRDGFLAAESEGRHYRGLIVLLKDPPMRKTTQDAFAADVAELEKKWGFAANPVLAQPGQATLEYTGLVGFAADSRTSIERDLGWLSTGSLVGVFLIVYLAFRTRRALILTWIPVGTALLGAFALTHTLLGGMHVLTLVFGSSLIGVCIDYGFHFMAHHRLSAVWDANAAMRQLYPGLLLAAGTTLLAYLGMALAPLPGLREMALFSGIGIVIALGTVLAWFPLWYAKPYRWVEKPVVFVALGNRLFSFWAKIGRRPLFGLAVLLLIALSGIARLRVDDDVRRLNGASPELLARDLKIRGLLGLDENKGYLLVKGRGVEEASRRLEELRDSLDEHAPVSLGTCPVDFVPSQARQRENIEKLRHLFGERRAELEQAYAELGLESHYLERYALRLEKAAESEPPFDLANWLGSELSFGRRQLVPGPSGEEYALLAPIQAVNDEAGMQALLAGRPGLLAFSQVAQLSKLIGHYREQASLWVALAYLIVGIVLWLRYGRRGPAVFAPPLAAALLALGILGWCGVELTIMHTVALILIAGIAVDYSIFVAESDREHSDRAMLALTLSALTTVLTFGLLALSHQPALRAIGLTSFLGIAAGWLLCPLTARIGGRS